MYFIRTVLCSTLYVLYCRRTLLDTYMILHVLYNTLYVHYFVVLYTYLILHIYYTYFTYT